jgi:hypothetical protein
MNQYGHILAVAGADALNHSADHPLYALAVVAVLLSRAQHRVHQHTLPAQLQGIETFAFFVGGLYSFPLLSLVVVHDHGIQIQFYQLRLGDRESPNENAQQNVPEGPDQWPGKGLKKPFDCMGGDQGCRVGFYCPCIGLILFQVVEIGQMPACAIYEKSKDLLENIVNRSSLFAPAQASKDRKQQLVKDPDFIQIANKKAEASPASDLLVSSFHAVDFTFAFRLLFAMLVHTALHFLGVSFWQRLAVNKAFYIRKLPKCGGLFM